MSEMTIEGWGRFFEMLQSMRLLRWLTPLFLIVTGGLLSPFLVEAAEPPPAIPDFTRGDRIPTELEKLDWVLGSTGLRGWMYAWKLETTAARQIVITDVAAMSPAAAQCSVGDVILGVDGVHFQGDPRLAFGQALTAAEGTDGRLRLLCWRQGVEREVVLVLPVLGQYGSTAPYDCPKSARILTEGCARLAQRMQADSRRGNPIERSLNALALLASGDASYLPLVAEEAHWAANFSIPADQGFHSWWYGYVTMFLAEYIIATGDETVFSGMERLAVQIARGQSAVGSWGHRFANPETGGLYGYGAMNSPGLSLTIALCLAREAGVMSTDVDRAIQRSVRWLRFYVGKGAIPYGDHHPWLETHDDNGKCGMGAVLFDITGDREAATFFSRMSTACHGPARDTGHTGNYFNLLWALPGVARSGPQATGAWLKEYGWYFDLARGHDGQFPYPGQPGEKTSYETWDSTGAFLLAYAFPLKQLRLTGRLPSVADQVDASEAASLIMDGKGYMPTDKGKSYEQRSKEELLKNLGSWSPVVRQYAADALAKRAGGDLVPLLLQLLEEESLAGRLGACAALEALGERGSAAVPALRQMLAHDDLWLRIQAGEALAAMGIEGRSAAPELLQLLVEENPQDPRGMTQRYAAFLLFHRGRLEGVTGLLSRSLDGIDRELLYAAVRAGLQNQDGRARGALSSVYEVLSWEELQPLLPAIYKAIVEPAPSGEMFADGIRMRGLKLLAEHQVAEGLPLCIPMMELDRWGKQDRIRQCLEALALYGGAARQELPALRHLEQQLRQHREAKSLSKYDDVISTMIATLEVANEGPQLRSIQNVIAR